MITNPTLATLSGEDWSQRYRNSLIDYDGRVRYCHSIALNPDGTVSAMLGDPIREAGVIILDPMKVNVGRPRGGWTTVKTGTNGKHQSPVFVWYSDARQYSRGYSRANTFMQFMGGGDVDGFEFDHLQEAIENLKLGDKKGPLEITTSDLEKVYKSNGIVINRLMALGSNGANHLQLYYRRRPIAQVKDGTINLENNVFEQEVREVLPNLKVKITGPKQSKGRAMPMPFRSAARRTAARPAPAALPLEIVFPADYPDRALQNDFAVTREERSAFIDRYGENMGFSQMLNAVLTVRARERARRAISRERVAFDSMINQQAQEVQRERDAVAMERLRQFADAGAGTVRRTASANVFATDTGTVTARWTPDPFDVVGPQEDTQNDENP